MTHVEGCYGCTLLVCPRHGADDTRAAAASLRSAIAKPKPRKVQPKDWQCQECGLRMTAGAAERAMFGAVSNSNPGGCRKCGGTDIDQVAP